MSRTYLQTIVLIERLHRHFLDVVKTELERKDVIDINNVQALILYNIGPDSLNVGELTARGYYLGSNVSYNVKKMVDNGYLIQERSKHDKRSIRVKLSEKGLNLQKTINQMFDDHVNKLSPDESILDALESCNATLRQLEEFWTSVLKYTPQI